MDMDKEAKWEENTSRAKDLHATRKHNQMIIAGLAMEVCDISWGGSNKEYANKYTLTRFADEAKINVKTLSNWIALRKKVFDKLPPKERDLTLTKLQIISKRLAPDSSVEHVYKIMKEVTSNNQDRTVLALAGSLRSTLYNFTVKDGANSLPIKTIEEVAFYCSAILKCIKLVHPKLKPRDNELVSLHAVGAQQSAASALGVQRNYTGIRVKDLLGHELTISPKDKSISDFMKRKKKKYFSPTEIGMIVGRHNANSATGWAHRTLNKFMSCGFVERNDKGHYRWIG